MFNNFFSNGSNSSFLGVYFIFISFNLSSQNFYSGSVVDQNNNPVIGASVFIENTTFGTQTDFNGKFNINAKINDVIVLSYIGFEKQKFTLSEKKELGLIILVEDISQLGEVIVVGYGNQNKEILTSSVSSINGDKLRAEPIINATQALQGKAAGVQIIASDAPGNASQVIIRGLGTILGGREPLYVVDGILTNNINNININDIENISVLKDAASLAIYGNRGANGVVIVSTKRGNEGDFLFNVDSNFGLRNLSYKVLMADADSFVTFSNEAIYRDLLTDSNPSNDNSLSYFFPTNQLHNTNWFNEISQIGVMTNHNVSASGGNSNMNSFTSFSINKEEGILIGNLFERATFRNNISFKLSNKIDYSHNISIQLANSTPKNFGIFTSAYKQVPIIPVFDENGRYGSSVAFNNVSNPVAQLDLQNEKQRFLKLQGAFNLDYEIFQDLTFTSRISIETNYNRFYNFENKLAYYLSVEPNNTIENFQPTDPDAPELPETVLSVSHNNDYRWFFDNYFTYKKTINEKHNLNATLGIVAEANKYESLFGSRINVPKDSNLNFNLNLGNNDDGTEESAGGFSEERKLYSYISRLNYNYDSQYILNASYRRDSANFFNEKYRHGNFFAISAGWLVSMADFMENSFFDILKLRISYGELGNAQIPSLNVVRFNQGFPYPFGSGQNTQQGGTVTATIQEDLSWETTCEYNFGVEFAFLNNKLSGEIDFYKRTNINAILPMELPDTFGFDPFLSHVGEISNTGAELNINWNDKINNDLSYSVESNMSYNKNELSNISNQFFSNQIGGSINNGQYTKKVSLGQPLGSFFLYEIEGIDDNGQFVYKDLNGDSEINDNDRRFFGSYIPSISIASIFKFEYKNFDFNLDLYGSFGNMVYNGKKAQRFGNENIEKYVFNNRWTKGRPSYTTPRASNSVPLSSNYYLESGDFFRLNNLTLGYTFKKSKSKIFKKIRSYITAKNPLVFKRFSGFTPELPGEPLGSAGIELDAYPTLSSYFLGISISF